MTKHEKIKRIAEGLGLDFQTVTDGRKIAFVNVITRRDARGECHVGYKFDPYENNEHAWMVLEALYAIEGCCLINRNDTDGFWSQVHGLTGYETLREAVCEAYLRTLEQSDG